MKWHFPSLFMLLHKTNYSTLSTNFHLAKIWALLHFFHILEGKHWNMLFYSVLWNIIFRWWSFIAQSIRIGNLAIDCLASFLMYSWPISHTIVQV